MTLMMNRLMRTSLLLVVCACLLAPTVMRAQAESPTQVFNTYRKTMGTAKTYSELFPLMESKGRAFIERMPVDNQAKMFELLKKFAASYTDVAVTKETVTGDTATLELSGKDPKGQAATGSVPMTKEASGWKVGTEKWSSKPR